MTQFGSIEQYIQFIAGFIDVNGTSRYSFWPEPIIQLANYDVQFVGSVATQVNDGVAMTDRQAGLAVKLIEKYAKQLRKHGVEQPDSRNFSLGIRIVSRTSSLTLNNDKLLLKFPFNDSLIDTIRECKKTSQGSANWNPDIKAWQFGLTEFNVSWCYAFAQAHNFQIDEQVTDLFNLIVESEKTPFSIELTQVNDKYEVVNAPKSLQDYIDSNADKENIYSMVDYASVLGYTISPLIQDQLRQLHGERFVNLCASRDLQHPASSQLDEVFEWAKIVNRYPIVIYNPNFAKINMEYYRRFFAENEIKIVGSKEKLTQPMVLDPAIKLVYTEQILTNWVGNIPLLITYANLLHGKNKRLFLERSEKRLYHCELLPQKQGD